MRRPLAILVLLSTATVFAERQPLERYGSLIERQMFGQPPPGFDPTKMPNEVAKTSSKEEKELSQEQEKVKKAIRFSVLNVTPSGETVVGFSDNGDPKNALHYYLKVGESQNGWTVKAADPEAATMTIEKDGIEVTLKLGGDSSTETDAVSRVGGATPRTDRTLPAKLGGESRLNSSIRERRRQNEERREAEAAKRLEEEKQARERIMNELQAMREEQRKDREEREAAEAAKNAESQSRAESESAVEGN